MKLKDQVCSLHFAKKLKELGVKQQSEFIYFLDIDSNWIVVFNPKCNVNYISAYTSIELSELLPPYIYTWKSDNLGSGKMYEWNCSQDDIHHQIKSDTEVNVKAKMLISILEIEAASTKGNEVKHFLNSINKPDKNEG
jgi:hypothetical protein